MLGNPYSSQEIDMGPLMREIKNKICRDCELVALLDDDNGTIERQTWDGSLNALQPSMGGAPTRIYAPTQVP